MQQPAAAIPQQVVAQSPLVSSESTQMMSQLLGQLNKIEEKRPQNPYLLKPNTLAQDQEKNFKGYKYYTQMQKP